MADDFALLTIIKYMMGIGTNSGAQERGALLRELARRIAVSGLQIDANGVVSGVGTAFPDGTVTVPPITFASDPDSGFYGGTTLGGGNLLGLALNGASQILFGVNLLRLKSTMVLGWASGVPDQTAEDVTLSRSAAGKLAIAGAAPQLQLGSGTAIPAGGTTGVGYTFSSTANFGVFFGSGVPTLSAAKGSLYMRSDGSSTSTRMYVNTDGGTTWTAVTTAT